MRGTYLQAAAKSHEDTRGHGGAREDTRGHEDPDPARNTARDGRQAGSARARSWGAAAAGARRREGGVAAHSVTRVSTSGSLTLRAAMSSMYACAVQYSQCSVVQYSTVQYRTEQWPGTRIRALASRARRTSTDKGGAGCVWALPCARTRASARTGLLPLARVRVEDGVVRDLPRHVCVCVTKNKTCVVVCDERGESEALSASQPQSGKSGGRRCARRHGRGGAGAHGGALLRVQQLAQLAARHDEHRAHGARAVLVRLGAQQRRQLGVDRAQRLLLLLARFALRARERLLDLPATRRRDSASGARVGEGGRGGASAGRRRRGRQAEPLAPAVKEVLFSPVCLP